jgi:hypothetical protein
VFALGFSRAWCKQQKQSCEGYSFYCLHWQWWGANRSFACQFWGVILDGHLSNQMPPTSSGVSSRGLIRLFYIVLKHFEVHPGSPTRHFITRTLRLNRSVSSTDSRELGVVSNSYGESFVPFHKWLLRMTMSTMTDWMGGVLGTIPPTNGAPLLSSALYVWFPLKTV